MNQIQTVLIVIGLKHDLTHIVHEVQKEGLYIPRDWCDSKRTITFRTGNNHVIEISRFKEHHVLNSLD